jgi:transposase
VSHFWCYAINRRPYAGRGHPAVFYRYSAEGERPRSHQESFSRQLRTDAFADHEALYRAHGNQPPCMTHVAGTAHARRKIFEVFDATKSPIAEKAPRRIKELYVIGVG